MIRYVQRGVDSRDPIGDLPLWLSQLLRARGIDTPQKADAFLHPDPKQLNDPMRMQDMGKAVDLIRTALQERWPVVVYGDYDVDGICATSIMVQTLRGLGGNVDYRIPLRHEQGYGLNEQAVRELHEQGTKLLITVDCGITNHEEVQLARMLGMTVIVTDHHQPADTPSPADAALNPLLGDYPFRRLCGAGVALKVAQALLGMDQVGHLFDLAALATVADMVPLVDENRIIVREGMKQMDAGSRLGIRMLMQVSGVEAPVNSGHIGFRLAPRLNAGGRLQDASQGVQLLIAADEQKAQRIADELDEVNQTRKAMEEQITAQAVAAAEAETDFLTDKAIIVAGDRWNKGVIGLAAGRISSRYHFPTIVLSRDDEAGVAVGSCRSIPGVNIHAMLSSCKDLFTRFGGHEMAAGLTIPLENIPELRRRLNETISANCDESCYIPTAEYDAVVSLDKVTLDMIDKLDALQPTGYGNPGAIFLTQRLQVQQARRVGTQQQHLKLTLLDGTTLRDGIGFNLGEDADACANAVDVLFTPSRNEFRGRVSAELQVEKLTPAMHSAPAPEAGIFDVSLLKTVTELAAADRAPVPHEHMTNEAVIQLLRGGRGTLVLSHEREHGRMLAQESGCETAVGCVKDRRGYCAVLFCPDYEKLTDIWRDIVLADGDLLPGELAMIRKQCPRARLHAMQGNPLLKNRLAEMSMPIDTLRTLYRRVLSGGSMTASALATDCGVTELQVMTAMQAFQETALVQFTLVPYAVHPLPMPKHRVDMEQTPVLRYLRELQTAN